MKNRWNAGILTITNRSVLNSDCGPVCDLKTVAEVSKRTGDVSRQPVSGRPRVTTPRQDRYLVISARRQRGSTARALGSDSRHRNTNFETNCLQETQSCWPVYLKTGSLHSLHVCA
ncbi:transposable element Tc3 transposase [Trichonephila clavipes]|uniref:Transposable element Tc3 transposase n=1 Tax=Trichonephila clavipes TaxID=2585209 RepID=A0A8X6VJK1_TRICX|nr:transposable element Tc3 transposase [Trichonephila clavipes]